MPRCHSPKQVGCKRGNAALARQVVGEKRNGLNAGGCFHNWTHLFPLFAVAIAGGLSNGDSTN
jgi:hypothetical protein